MSKVKLTEFQLLDLIATYESSVSKLRFQINDFETTLKTLKSDLKEVRAAAKVAPKKSATTIIKKTASPAAKKVATPAAKKPAGRRGRPRKTPVAVSVATSKTETTPKAEAPVAKKPAGRRGRPRKNPISATAAKTTTNGVVKAKTPATKTTAKATPKATPKAKTPVKKTPAKKTAAKKATAKKVTAKDNEKGYKLSDWDQLVFNSVKTANRVLTRSELDTLVNKRAGSLKKGMEMKQVNAKVSNVLHKLTNKRNVLKKGKTPENKTGYMVV
ncbi:MAG: hypothetical protein AB8H47_15055 [Bacteroidia bacterium]